MKSKLLFLATLLFLTTTLVRAQTGLPNGKVRLIEFSNETASFTVPEGKAWLVYNIFSDYLTDGSIKYDEYQKKNAFTGASDLRIFLKNLNGEEKTNHVKNLYGTQLFRSSNASTVIPYPIFFPGKTSFQLVILKGEVGAFQLFNGKGYLSFLEIDN